MKKLYFKNGLYKEAKASQDTSGKYICIYEDGVLIYSVYEGNRPMQNSVIFTIPAEDLPHYVILQIAEIIENFNQYYNNINQ
jgi:hypothetical protein